MGRVMIRCPEFGRLIFTGVQIKKDEWENPEVRFENSYPVRCLRCGQLHQWTKSEAVYEDEA